MSAAKKKTKKPALAVVPSSPAPRAGSAPEVVDVAGDLAEIERLTKAYEEESTIEGAAAKMTLARTLAEEVVRRRRLVTRDLAGTLPAEQSRTIAGMTSNIKRLMTTLGLDARKSSKKSKGFIGA